MEILMSKEISTIFEIVAMPYVHGNTVSLGLFRNKEDAEYTANKIRKDPEKKHHWATIVVQERDLQ